MKQYWADAATKNCVWLFQAKETRCNKEHGCTCGAEYDEEGDIISDQAYHCARETYGLNPTYCISFIGDEEYENNL